MNNSISEAVKPKSDRIVFLDVLRGIAIQFIFIANIIYLSGFEFFKSSTRWEATALPTDKFLEYMTYTLIDGKFYSIFSLLFGIGCVVQYENMKRQGRSFQKFFAKRMFFLLIFGLIHLLGLWLGDILTVYALLGFALIPCVHLKNRTLLISASILLLMPILNDFFMFGLGYFYPGPAFNSAISIYQFFEMPLNSLNGRPFPSIQHYILNTNLPDFFKMNLGNAFIRIANILLEGRLFKVFGIFLIGLWVGRKILKEDLLNNHKFLIKAMTIGFVIGLPFSLLRTYINFFKERDEFWDLLFTISYALGTVPLAIAFASGLSFLFKSKPHFLNWLAPVGKMAFTNYIIQTLICIVIFYGIGFGLGGSWGYTLIVLFAISVFLIQSVFSKFWLRHFHFGPLEWIWRQLTYGKSLPIKRQKF